MKPKNFWYINVVDKFCTRTGLNMGFILDKIKVILCGIVIALCVALFGIGLDYLKKHTLFVPNEKFETIEHRFWKNERQIDSLKAIIKKLDDRIYELEQKDNPLWKIRNSKK